MGDELFEKALKGMGKLYRHMKRGSECPPDDVLLDYAYKEVTDEERERISTHIKDCERCRFGVMKIETDRDVWEEVLNKDPDAALAQILGATIHTGQKTRS